MIQARLMNLLNIRPGEGRNVFLMLAHYFFMGAAMLLAASASLALFFETWDTTALPYVYLGIAVIVSSITSLFLKFSERTSVARFLVPCLAFILFGTVALRIGLAVSASPWLLLSLPIWSNTLLYLSVTAFWMLAGNIFDIRQGKRIFGLMNAGSWLAYVVIGPFITPLVNAFGTENLYTVVALCVLIALGFLLAVLRANPHTTAPPPATHPVPVSLRSLLRKRYIVLIFSLMTVWHIAFFFLDNIFYDHATRQFPNADEMAGFIGLFFAAAGLLGFITDVFLTGRILSRFGLRAGLLTTPTLTIFLVTALVLTGFMDGTLIILAFWFASLGRFVNEGLGFSLDQSTFAVLNQPLEERERARVQAITEGIVRPLATGLAGGLLLLFSTLFKFNAGQLAYLYLLIAAVWATVAISLIRAYPGALKEALHKRRIGENGLAVIDLASHELLQKSLHSPHPEDVIYALELLQQTGRDSFLEVLLEQIKSQHRQVRIHVIHTVERLNLVEALPAIKNQLKYETDGAIREAATSALTSLRVRYAHLLDATDPHIQRGALAGLLRGQHADKFADARNRLSALTGSPSAPRRREAAELIGASGNPAISDLLLPLLSDPDPGVRTAALRAAGKLKHPELWPAVLPALEDLDTRQVAFATLVQGGEAALSAIMPGIVEPTFTLPTRIRLVRASGKIKSPAAIAELRKLMNVPNTSLRSRVLIALHTCGFAAEPDFVPQIEAQIQTEVRRAVWLLASLCDLDSADDLDLLRRALRHDLRETRSRIFFLFSFLYDPVTVRWAYHAIDRADETRRAYAIEALEALLTSAHLTAILPLLEKQTEQEMLNKLAEAHRTEALSREQRLLSILSDPYTLQAPWVAATALHTARQLNLPGYEQAAADLLNSNDSAVAHHVERTRKDTTMLSTFERVMILKSISLFAHTPDEALAELADRLEETEVQRHRTVVEKGERGDSLYVIVRGRVSVLDDERTLNELGERALFGELSLLDSEPRSATIRALEDTTLLRLDQAAFYDLMADYVEVAMGTIQMLTRNLRARTKDVAELNRILKP